MDTRVRAKSEREAPRWSPFCTPCSAAGATTCHMAVTEGKIGHRPTRFRDVKGQRVDARRIPILCLNEYVSISDEQHQTFREKIDHLVTRVRRALRFPF